MTVLVGLNILVSSLNSGRRFRAISGTTHCLAACHSLAGSTPSSCFRGRIFNFHLRLAACIKYFLGFPKYLQTDAWIHSFIHSFIPLACAECNDSLPFSGASSIPICYVLFPAPFSTNCSAILPHFILPPISWSTSQSSCFQIHI